MKNKHREVSGNPLNGCSPSQSFSDGLGINLAKCSLERLIYANYRVEISVCENCKCTAYQAPEPATLAEIPRSPNLIISPVLFSTMTNVRA